MSRWPVKKIPLNAPSLNEVAAVIDAGLKLHFKHATAEVAPCPDLRQVPYGLAAEGLCGNERIADVGGPPHLHPWPQLDKKYSLLDLIKAMEMPAEKGFILGAGAGPFDVVGVNSELMPNLSYDKANGNDMTNLTHFAKVDERGSCFCGKIPNHSVDCALMMNLFGSDGRPGDVIKIVAKERTGKLNFTDVIQEALKAKYGDRTVSLGGVFVIRKGKASLHVMPDFSKTPLATNEDTKKWLRFYDMAAPLVCLSVFHSYDPGLALRMEHTHCFSDHGEGGHYHGDTTPAEVEYEAYFNTAKLLYRIDEPRTDGHGG
jgi:hypothetical protein